MCVCVCVVVVFLCFFRSFIRIDVLWQAVAGFQRARLIRLWSDSTEQTHFGAVGNCFPKNKLNYLYEPGITSSVQADD